MPLPPLSFEWSHSLVFPLVWFVRICSIDTCLSDIMLSTAVLLYLVSRLFLFAPSIRAGGSG